MTAGAGSLETTKPKSVTAGVQRRGRWDVIGFGGDEGKLEIQVKKDAMVDGCELSSSSCATVYLGLPH